MVISVDTRTHAVDAALMEVLLLLLLLLLLAHGRPPISVGL